MLLTVMLMTISFTLPALAGTGDAYFFGYSEDDFDTTDEMENVENHLDRMGYYTKIYVNPLLSKFTEYKLNSTFLYFAGHGNRYELNTGEDRGICIDGEDGYKDINSTDFSDTKLAILAACKCGDTSHSTCLAKEINRNGATAVLAWRSSVNSQVLAEYTDNYVRFLKRGNTFETAMVNTFQYLTNECGIGYDSSVFELVIYGDGDERLDDADELENKNSYAESRNLNNDFSLDNSFLPYVSEDIKQQIIKEDVDYIAGTKDYTELENYIKDNIDINFDINDYMVKEYGEEYGANSIVFRLLVNGVPSNYGFSIICVNGKAGLVNFTNVYDNYNNIEINSKDSLKSLKYNDDVLYKKAREADGYSYDIDEQYIQKYYDIETNKVINEVNTVYVDENGMLFCTLNVF